MKSKLNHKIASLLVAFSVVIASVSPAFALDVANPSAISFNAPLRASAGLTATTATDYAQSIYQYITGTNGFPALVSGQTAIRNLITNHFYSNGMSFKTWNASTGIGTASASGYFKDYISTALNIISDNIAKGDEQIWDLKEYYKNNNIPIKDSVQHIEEILTTTGAFDTVKIVDNPNNGFSKSYLWGKYAPMDSVTSFNWFNGRSKIVSNFDYKNSPLLGTLLYHFRTQMTSFNNLAVNLVGSIGNYSLTNNDLTTTPLGDNTSIANDLRNIGANLSGNLARLAYVLASDQEIEAKQASSDNQESFVNNFVKPSGSGSASLSDFGTIADSSSDVSDALNSGASPSQALGILSSDDSSIWDWFTQTTANELDTTNNNSNRLRSVSPSNTNTPYLDAYYKELQGYIGGQSW